MKIGVHKGYKNISDPALAIACELVEAADPKGPDTALRNLCFSYGPVDVHTDVNPPGALVLGLVLLSEGHRLFVGVDDQEGIELEAGDFYAIAPDVPHWTQAPTDRSLLIFAPFIAAPDGRSIGKYANDLMMTTTMSLLRWKYKM